MADQDQFRSDRRLSTRTPPRAAALVYFDIVGAYGIMHGTVEIELATRILVPTPNGLTDVKFLSSGRLRCSPTAAANLRNALDAALKMLEAAAAATRSGGRLQDELMRDAHAGIVPAGGFSAAPSKGLYSPCQLLKAGAT